MRALGISRVVLIATALLTTLTAGCATVGDERVNPLYHRTGNASGGSGEFYIVEETPPATGGASTIQWILGEVRDKDGEKLGNVVTDTAPIDVVASAYAQELRGAGYNTIQRGGMPPDAAKGLVLKSVTVKLDEVKSAASLEVKSKVMVTAQPWRNGQALGTLSYEADYTETAVTGRDELPSKSLQHAIGTVMTRSVPDIVKRVENR